MAKTYSDCRELLLFCQSDECCTLKQCAIWALHGHLRLSVRKLVCSVEQSSKDNDPRFGR